MRSTKVGDRKAVFVKRIDRVASTHDALDGEKALAVHHDTETIGGWDIVVDWGVNEYTGIIALECIRVKDDGWRSIWKVVTE